MNFASTVRFQFIAVSSSNAGAERVSDPSAFDLSTFYIYASFVTWLAAGPGSEL